MRNDSRLDFIRFHIGRKNNGSIFENDKKIVDDKKVVYRFGPNERQMGEIEFDKEEKSFKILKKVNDSKISNKAYENWASEQIIKIMFKNKGLFPDVTSVEK